MLGDTFARWRGEFGPVEKASQGPQMTLSQVLERHELVEVTDSGVVVVAANPPPSEFEIVQRASRTSVALADTAVDWTREMAGSGKSQWTSHMRDEYLPELRGSSGLRMYDKMRRGDGRVRASLRAIKTPILAARWFIEPAKQRDGTVRKKDQTIADMVWENFTEWMTISWPQVIYEAMLQFDFGYYMFEKVADVRIWRGRPVVYYRKFAPRHPLDVMEWLYDPHGGPDGVRMPDPDDPYNSEGVPIPIGKLIVFTHDREAGNMEGLSILRSAYKHWYFKENLYKIDAIQKERHGIGVPVIKLPVGFTPSDRVLANEMGRNLRTNEKAHIVLPPNWSLEFARLEGQPVDAISSIEHHDKAIVANILASFLVGEGSGDAPQDLFVKSCLFAVQNILDVFNKHCIPWLVQVNWAGVDRYPVLRARRVGDTTDWRSLSFAIRNLVGAGIIKVDDRLEEWFREEMDLPEPDPTTAREIATPQQVRVGPPRQSTAPGMQQQARGTGKTNVGTDRSGED